MCQMLRSDGGLLTNFIFKVLKQGDIGTINQDAEALKGFFSAVIVSTVLFIWGAQRALRDVHSAMCIVAPRGK